MHPARSVPPLVEPAKSFSGLIFGGIIRAMPRALIRSVSNSMSPMVEHPVPSSEALDGV
jgi:hypothetical protein